MTVTQNPVQVTTTWHAQHRAARGQETIRTEHAAATALLRTAIAMSAKSDVVTHTSIDSFHMHLSLLLELSLPTSWWSILQELQLLNPDTDTISAQIVRTFDRRTDLEAECFSHVRTA